MVDISVIIPIYNVKEYLEDCLNSLLIQSLLNCEFICIDDGSTDDSYKIVESYMGKDKRFKMIRQKNKGLAETNEGERLVSDTDFITIPSISELPSIEIESIGGSNASADGGAEGSGT